MKLYTEEQVRQSFIAGMEFIAVDPLKYEQDANEYMNTITPIELPSDEEILKESDDYELNSRVSLGMHISFEAGAKWLRDKIQGGEK